MSNHILTLFFQIIKLKNLELSIHWNLKFVVNLFNSICV